ncbi:hypothetical protein [uncultured Thiocystis sp.]|uniref:hypothetical protein n=1 Tax=uncultured Thiocystis sp. TaxID=1202134 RepID=UPI0025D8CCF1|nr:hypothetical protein [uncultured Thiocystis sp.]
MLNPIKVRPTPENQASAALTIHEQRSGLQMKTLLSLLVLGLTLSSASVYSQAARDNSNRPCFDVNVQIDRNNRSNVDQDCGQNYSRTMQAGQNNEATTYQSGDVNDNKVRQYGQDGPSRR